SNRPPAVKTRPATGHGAGWWPAEVSACDDSFRMPPGPGFRSLVGCARGMIFRGRVSVAGYHLGAPMHTSANQHHPLLGRRAFLQAGTIGALGLSMTDVAQLRSATPAGATSRPKAVIFLFLTGGASQHDTFDMKPRGPAEFKGEFNPIATRTPGIH